MISPVITGDVSVQFKDFEKMLFETFDVKQREELPFKKVEYVFDIFRNSQDFSFDDEDERLSNLLILTACLYSVKKKEKVCFVSPTYFYAQQAARMRSLYLKALGAPEQSSFSTVVPGMDRFNECIKECKVVFMHGKDFTEYLPKGWEGRKIIQIFPGIEVPVDHIPRRVCHYDNE
jgi:hypothetical protein